MDLGRSDLSKLTALFNEIDPNRGNENDSDCEEATDVRQRYGVRRGPGDIGGNVSENDKASQSKDKVLAAKKPKKYDIWSEAEVKGQGDGDKGLTSDSGEIPNISLVNDPRKTPIYDIHYRQAVTTEDVYLQMGNKTPGTASCEDLVVEIHLPGDNYQGVQLNLKSQAIDLRSPIHFLYLNLPHPIDPRAGNAKWDRDLEKLTVTLKLSRELDPFNF